MSAPDADIPTVHIRCGSDIKDKLAQAGFVGDFVEIAYPFGYGPATCHPARDDERVQFMLDRACLGEKPPKHEVMAWLRAGEDGLVAAQKAPRVVIWLEHDSFDQLVLLRCMAQFAGRMPGRLELISVDDFPVQAERFIGIGQLSPQDLLQLWPRRWQLSQADAAEGRRAWEALIASDPTALAAIMRADNKPFPHLPKALRRHLQELPSTATGLSLSETLALQCAAGEPIPYRRMFYEVNYHLDPLPWLADSYFYSIVEDLRPLLDQSGGLVRLNDTGRSVLAGEKDWVTPRWVGGVRIEPGQPNWRWDGEKPVYL